MAPGVAAAQIVHAAGESAMLGSVPDGTFAVVLSAPDELTLKLLADKLGRARVQHVCIVECDGPLAGQMTAIGVRPGQRAKLRRYFDSIPLYRGAVAQREQRAAKAQDAGSTPAGPTNCPGGAKESTPETEAQV